MPLTPEQLTQTANKIDWHKPVTLADIVDAISEVKDVPQPFNGARRIMLSRDIFEKLADVLKPYMGHALTRATLDVEVRDALPSGYGVGYRPWRDGDDPEVKFMGEVMVWFLGPKSPDVETV